ncbi:MAG: hypothetical protein IKR71_06860 [Bacteroidales bacterium]|nr:hypothetical protein [Bacteroidales bacterium]
MRRRNFEGDYNLLFEKQTKYEEALQAYHERNKKQENASDKSVETEDKDAEAQNHDNKQ